MAKRRRRLKKSVRIVLSIILISLVGLLVFLIYSNTSKYLFFKGISKSSNEIIDIYNDLLSQYMPFYDDYYYNNTNTSINVETNELDDSMVFNGDIYLSKDSVYYDLGIDVNKNKYNLDLYNKDDRLYYSIDDSKYYYKNVDLDLSFNYEYDKLFKVFVKSLKSNVSNSDFTKTKENININNKDYNSKKISLVINNDLYSEVMKNFYSKVMKDDSLIDCLFSISSYETRDMLVNHMEGFVKNGSSDKDLSYEYSIYYKGSKPIKHNIISKDLDLSYVSVKDFIEVNYTSLDSISTITYVDNKIDIYFSNIGYIKFVLSEGKIDAEFSDMNDNSLGSFLYKINGDKKYDVSMSLKLKLELITIEVNSNNKIEIDKKVPSINISNSISEEHITEEDSLRMNELMQFLNTIIAF